MSRVYIEDEIFNALTFNNQNTEEINYESCTFTNVVFTNAYLSKTTFTSCLFNDCDFSLTRLGNTSFKEVEFKNCKMLGLRFDECYPFLLSFSFEKCKLNLASFYQLKINNTLFKDCDLQEVDFTETELSGSTFNNCDLTNAIFDHTVLEKVDFRSSQHYSINPLLNNIKKAKFSATELKGLLDSFDIIIE